MTYAPREKPLSASFTRSVSRPMSDTLRVGGPNDAYEQEADRVAAAVMSGRRTPSWSISNMKLATVQRQAPGSGSLDRPAPKPNNYDEAAKKIGEAFLKTDAGKKLTDAAKQDALVKGAESFIHTLPGKIIAGAAAVGVVSALAATHTPLPAEIPEIPLDSIKPGLSVKITYEGPVNHPTKAAITFSYSPKGKEKKPKETASERYRAETARMAAEQEKFRAGMTYTPGSKEDLEQKAEQKAMQDYVNSRFGSLPGFGSRPLVPGTSAPAIGGPGETLDNKLGLKPLSSVPGAESKKKEEPAAIQRKAADNSSDASDGIVSRDVLPRSAGRPLDPETRIYMESRFGFDFSKVRIHSDPEAATSAKAVNALAYTVGSDVVFGAGRYVPSTTEGRRLLAHELTHTIQQ
ncbi:MAG: DUF4157 domain-containing protein, partial [Bryobacteraceae bacterium]